MNLLVKIQCPVHQRWPFTGTAATVADLTATCNLKNFHYRCSKCGASGFLTKALSDDFQVENSGK